MGEGDAVGWGGVEGWGENADNCRIKKLKKKSGSNNEVPTKDTYIQRTPSPREKMQNQLFCRLF